MPHGGIIVNNNDNPARRGYREVCNSTDTASQSKESKARED